jgi:hypothetical protein
MGDHTTDTDRFCDQLLLGRNNLQFDKDLMRWLSDSDHVDCFLSKSRSRRGNECISIVSLFPYAFDDQDDGFWDKFGQAIGNLQERGGELHISTLYSYHDHDAEDEVVPIPHWEILARILSHARQKITLTLISHFADISAWHAEDIRSFARVICGHPTITAFYCKGMSPYEALDALYSALTTLPALESVFLSTSLEDGITSAPETLTELLRAPSLRSVCFNRFYFTRALCQATANAFMEGTAVTKLEFITCSFSAEECVVMMANGLARNTSVSYIKVELYPNEALYSVLATALPSNSTLRRLDFGQQYEHGGPDSSSVFLALGKNTGLNTIRCGFGLMDESLCTAMQNGLGMNATLESLELNHHTTLSVLDAALWCRALSFLRTSKVLKSLTINIDNLATRSYVSAFCSHIAAMLQENASLERLSIGWTSIVTSIKAEEYFVFVTALQHNKSLNYLSLKGNNERVRLTHDEDKQMASLLKKNYTLESLPIIYEGGDVSAILQLNNAGRRYLVQDGSSISKGVEVLSSVNNDLNCVFLHLLENPRLCDRRAVEMVSAGGRVNDSDS